MKNNIFFTFTLFHCTINQPIQNLITKKSQTLFRLFIIPSHLTNSIRAYCNRIQKPTALITTSPRYMYSEWEPRQITQSTK